MCSSFNNIFNTLWSPVGMIVNDYSGVLVTRSLVLCVCFVDRCVSFCTFNFGHCVACSSSIYGFWLPFGIFKLFLSVRNIWCHNRPLFAVCIVQSELFSVVVCKSFYFCKCIVFPSFINGFWLQTFHIFRFFWCFDICCEAGNYWNMIIVNMFVCLLNIF